MRSSNRPGDGQRRKLSSMASIEQQIAGLKPSIAPRSRHRDAVLDRVSESSESLSQRTRVARVTVALSCLLIVISPAIAALTRIEAPAPQTADQANSDALRLSEQNRLSFDWALVDVFEKFRDDTSAAINQPSPVVVDR